MMQGGHSKPRGAVFPLTRRRKETSPRSKGNWAKLIPPSLAFRGWWCLRTILITLRNWRAFKALGISRASCPGGFFSSFQLLPGPEIGTFSGPRSPDDPIVVHMLRAPCLPGAPTERDQHRAGRAELLETSLEVFETHVRDQLGRALSAGGFDADKDIAAIIVNRWPHGYAYQYNSLWDPFWLEGGPLPCVEARKPFGRIAIANADADAYAYTDCAINQAHRAVNDLKIAAS